MKKRGKRERKKGKNEERSRDKIKEEKSLCESGEMMDFHLTVFVEMIAR